MPVKKVAPVVQRLPRQWVTPTDPPLRLYIEEDEGTFTLCLAGDRIKELMISHDRAWVIAAFERVKALYE
jgi:hypothetical protein